MGKYTNTVIAVLAIGYLVFERVKYVTETASLFNNDVLNNALASAFILPILVAVLFFVIAPIVGNTVQEWQTRPAKKNA